MGIQVDGLVRRGVSLICATLIALQPLQAAPPQRPSAQPVTQIATAANPMHELQFDAGDNSAQFRGLKVERLSTVNRFAAAVEPRVFVSCGDGSDMTSHRIRNVTRECAEFSILSSVPIRISVPYDLTALPEGISEREVRLFDLSRVASAGPMAPIEAHLDLENKTSIATLSEISGRFVNGVLKAGERPDRPPSAVSDETLKSLRKTDPLAGRPIVPLPEPNTDGDLRLSYPIDFPGSRSNLRPSISIAYSAQSPGGNIADGWRLNVPAIAIETRWGVPVFDPNFETETYLFNGEQLVMETGDYVVDAPQAAASTEVADEDRRLAALNLAPLPHRTTKLRPRVRGKAHFVLGRDEGLWRFVRHGDAPSVYWWEAWQENPSSETIKVSYFGRAPGRLEGDVWLQSTDGAIGSNASGAERFSAVLRQSEELGAPVIRWTLAREKDAFGNIVDYRWFVTNTSSESHQPGKPPRDRDIYLDRVIYTAHQDIEETILRCRENPSLGGCRQHQGLYEIAFQWGNDAKKYQSRPDARHGGWVVPNRLLERIDYRFRRRTPGGDGSPARLLLSTDQPAGAPRTWQCSQSFLAHVFETDADPLFNDAAQARRWLSKATKIAPAATVKPSLSEADEALFPGPFEDCETFAVLGDGSRQETRFAYRQPARDPEGKQHPFLGAPYEIKAEFLKPTLSDLSETAATLIGQLTGKRRGPFSANLLGATETEEVSGGGYAGISLAPQKAPGAGFQRTFSSRTAHNEATLLVDVDGDGISDLLVRDRGRWTIYRGALNERGELSFNNASASSATIPHDLPFGFRFQHEPVMRNSGSGFELAPWGTLGISSQTSTSIQTHYLADMDGDGKVDVVVPGGVFYNNSNTRPTKDRVNMGPFTRYIRASEQMEALRPAVTTAPAADALIPADAVSIAQLTQRAPRYDTVRMWRSPFRGIVAVQGDARFAGRDDALDVKGEPESGRPHPDLRRETPHQPRDGLILAIERSRSGAPTLSCDAHIVGPGVLTAPRIPEPDGPGVWRLAGSVSVRKNQSAQYFVTLSPERPGVPPPVTGRRVKLSLQNPSNATVVAPDDFRAAVKSAVSSWIGEQGSTLAFDEATGELTFKGERRMAPLIISVPIKGTNARSLSLRFGVELRAVTDGSSVGGDALLVTKIFDDQFILSGVRCIEGSGATELAAAAATLLGTDAMLASVEPGDVLYFRTHSIDDGNGDAVRWSPSITYLRAHEPLFGSPGSLPDPPWRTLLDYNAATTPDGDQSVVCPSAPQSLPGHCASAVDIIKTPSSLCTTEDRKAGLCDALARSLIRYRLASGEAASTVAPVLKPEPGDYPTLALSTGSLTISKAGRVRISGSLEKRHTPGPMALELHLLPAPQPEKERPACHAHRPPDNARSVRLTFLSPSGAKLPNMPTEEGIYRIDPGSLAFAGQQASSGAMYVRPDETICMFLRHLEPIDQVRQGQVPERFWPYDAASVSVRNDDPVAVRYETIVAELGPAEELGVDRDLAFRPPTHPLYGYAIAASACAPDGQLGQVQVTAPVGVTVDAATAKILEEAAAANANKTKLACFALNSPQSRYDVFVAPLAVDGVVDSVGLASRFEVGPSAPDGTRPLVEIPIRGAAPTLVEARSTSSSASPWSKGTALACPAGQTTNGVFARRFQFDVRVAGETPRIFTAGDPILGQAIARIKTLFQVREGGGTTRPAPARLFTIQRQGTDGVWITIPIEPRHLGAAILPSNERLVFEAPGQLPRTGISQSFHVIGNAKGTMTLTSFASSSGISVTETLLSSAYVGVELCLGQNALDRQEALNLVTSFDEDSWRSNVRASRLLDAAPCVDQGLTTTPFSTNVFVRRPEHVCPIVEASLVGSIFERHAAVGSAETRQVWLAQAMPLSVTFSPRPMVETETASIPVPVGHLNPQDASNPLNANSSIASPRALNSIAIQSLRRSHAVAVLVEPSGSQAGRDIRDPLVAASVNAVGLFSANDPNRLPALPKYSDLLSNVASPSTGDLNRVQSIINGAVNAPNGCGAADGEVNNVITKCREVEGQVDLIAQPRKAFAFQTDYRRPAYDDDGRLGTGLDGQDRRVDGADGPVAGQLLEDKACRGAPVAFREQGDDSVRDGSPFAYLLAGQARKSAEVRAFGGFDPELPRICGLGPDASIWVSGELVSASRLGIKNIHEGERRERLRASAQAVGGGGLAPAMGAGLRGVPKTSSTSGYSRQLSLGASLSNSRSSTSSATEMIDLNGDGFPDLVVNGAITYTDPSGNVRCAENAIWKQVTPICAGGSALPGNQKDVRASSSTSNTVGIGIPFSFPDYSKTYKAAANFSTSSPSGVGINESGGSTAPNWGSILSVEAGTNNGNRLSDIVDVNGDGLPDIVLCNGGCTVRFNLGHRFTDPVTWPGLALARDQGLQAGLGISPSFSTPDGSFAGGLSAGTNSAASVQLLVDVNGDGLQDLIQQDGTRIKVRLATGSGFSDWLEWGSLPRPIAQSETDRMGGGAAFTIPIWIPLTPLWAIISPFGSLGASLARSTTLFRDIDGDGFPDLVIGKGVSERPGSWPSFGFDNNSAQTVSNRLAQHGLLEHVWLSTNPHNFDTSKSNYTFAYGRTAKSSDDPNHRFVLRAIAVRDGVTADDDPLTVSANERRTCYTYGAGYYDRFERRFLGYGRIHVTEGCSTPLQNIPALTTAGIGADYSIAGVRRIERTYANRTIYESGLLTDEKVFDLTVPVVGGAPRIASRHLKNVHILVDTALSTHARIVCHGLRREALDPLQTAVQSAAIGMPYVPAKFASPFNPDSPTYCRDTFASADDPDPTFDIAPRRLTPALVQTLRETREVLSGNDQVMRTAARFEVDHLARVVRACDLGELAVEGRTLKETRGAACSAMAYDRSVRPQFTHGTTGGGTILVEQRNIIREVVVAHFRPPSAGLTDAADDPSKADMPYANDNILGFANSPAFTRIVRRRTAAHDPQTGGLSKLCQFTRFERGVADPCGGFEHYPRRLAQLEEAAAAGVALRAYQHDRYGNVQQYLGPMGTGRSFVAKRYEFDPYLNVVEKRERTHFCIEKPISTQAITASASCLNTVSGLGELRSAATMIDYRHAAPTLSVDVNGQATNTILDGLGRPLAVYGTWALTGPICAAAADECKITAAIKPEELQSSFGNLPNALRLIVRYSHSDSNSSSGAHPGPSTVVESIHQRDLFRLLNGPAPKANPLGLKTITFADQVGQVVQQISPHESCLSPEQAPSGATICGSLASWTASGISLRDQLGRPVAERFPVAVKSLVEPSAIAPSTSSAPESTVSYDGFDRRLSVRLPDGNGYAFNYRVATSINSAHAAVRHRTELVDALCTPAAMERDVRGAIRTVVEGARDVLVEQRISAALGSSARQSDEATILAAGLVGSIRASATGNQQVYQCKAPTAESFFQPGLRQTVTAYDRDVLGQLVAVRLPERSTTAQPRPSNDNILVAYDGLGRRIAVDDPDRGYERLQLDPLGNAFCRYVGTRRRALIAKDVRHATFDQMVAAISPAKTDGGPTDIVVNPTACPDPKSDDRGIMRITRAAHLAGLPLATAYKVFDADEPAAELAAARRSIRLSYGVASLDDDKKANRVGRAYRTVDASGSETREYDGVGRLAKAVREFAGLSSSQGPRQSVTLITNETRDVWGLLASRKLDITMRGYAASSQPKRFEEQIGYRYTIGGQIADVLGASGTTTPLNVIADEFRYDERGNLLGHVNTLGIATNNTFNPVSNRLEKSRSVMDLGDPTIRPLAFQNLSYRYDPAGNVITYANAPAMAGPCLAAANQNDCAVTDRVAKAYGLVVSGSTNEFSYDQLNRLRTATKVIDGLEGAAYGKLGAPYDKDGNPQVVSQDELAKARALRISVAETFAFEPTHEMSVLARRTDSTVAGKTTTRQMVSRYTIDAKPRHAPGRIDAAVREGTRQYNVKTTFGIDDMGRMTASLCERSDGKSCNPDRYFEWNADDTMSTQTVQIPDERLSDSKKKGNNLVFYDHVVSDFDASGRRTRKELNEQGWLPSNNGDKPDKQEFVSETLYADSQLTIMRRPDGQPEAIVHYFAGPLRIASRWVGDDRLFTYHAHLLTRNVTDIAVGRFAPGSALPKSARIHGQQEYAAFGEIIHERENLLIEAKDGQTARSRMGLVHYRFNAKEQDESGLQDFGARFYDNRLALWLRPDPVLHDYLDGRLNGGVFAPRNLASYGFGWGNPVSSVDPDGNAVFLAAAVPLLINAGRAAVSDVLQGYAIQALEMQLGQRIDFDHGEIAQGAAIAAVTGGIGSLRKAERLGELAMMAEKAAERGTRSNPLHVVYSYVDKFGDIYVGRTRGVGTAKEIADRRINAHSRRVGYEIKDRNVEHSTRSYSEARGYEEIGIMSAGGSRRSGGAAANEIGGISPSNQKADQFMRDGDRVLSNKKFE